MSTITMSYGSYNFIPVPLMTAARKEIRAGDTRILGKVLDINLDGVLVNPNAGLAAIDALEDALESGVNRDGLLFLLLCDSAVVLSGYPRINSDLVFNKSQDNKISTSPYTLSFQFDDTDSFFGNMEQYSGGLVAASGYIETFNEDWQIEFAEKAHYSWILPGSITDANPLYSLKITHNINAKGRRRWGANGLYKDAWQQARDYIVPRLGIDQQFMLNSGVMNLGAAATGVFDHIRSQNTNEADGTFSVTESWLVLNSGTSIPKPAIEDFTISLKTDAGSAITSIGIEGSVQGLEQRDYGRNVGDFSILTTKYANASGYFNTAQNRLLGRVQNVFNGSNIGGTLNVSPLSTTIGHNLAAGTITYNYEYNTRRSNCLAAFGATQETITVTDGGLTDIFAEIVIPGRPTSLLQSFNTRTNFTRSVSIEAVFIPPTTICPTDMTTLLASGLVYSTAVENLLDNFRINLESTFDQVFLTENTYNWNINENRVSATRAWKTGSC